MNLTEPLWGNVKFTVDGNRCENPVDDAEIVILTTLSRKLLGRLAKFPFLTVALILLSVLYFVVVRKLPSNNLLRWILSPIIHDPIDPQHLIANVIGLCVIGPLIELWITPLSLTRRCHLFLIGYCIDALISIRSWWIAGEPAYGLSVYIFAFLAFAVYYYVRFPSQQTKAQRIAPLAIGFTIGVWVSGFYRELLQEGFISAANQEWNHMLAFIFGLLAVILYFAKKNEA